MYGLVIDGYERCRHGERKETERDGEKQRWTRIKSSYPIPPTCSNCCFSHVRGLNMYRKKMDIQNNRGDLLRNEDA